MVICLSGNRRSLPASLVPPVMATRRFANRPFAVHRLGYAVKM
jgi:hypothetical protein